MAFNIPLGDLLVRLTGDSTVFEKMVDDAQKKITAAGAKLEQIGQRMTAAITTPLLAIGAVSVKAFSDFDNAMTTSTAIMGNISAEMRKELEKTALELSTRSVTSAEKLAQAYYFLASAGLTVQQSIQALPVVERFAVAGAFDLEMATSLLADSQSALGLASKDATVHMRNMTRVADVLTMGGIVANASVEELAKSLTRKAASGMRFLNMEVEQGVAILAAYAAQGIKGEEAGTQFDILLRELQNSISTNSEAWAKLGLSVYDSTGRIRPVVDIIEDLTRVFEPLSHQQRTATAAMLGFRSESFAAIRPLLGQADALRDYEKALFGAGGATADVAQRQMKAFSQQAAILRNQLTAIAIEIGEDLVPWLRDLGEWLSEQIKWWRGLSEQAKELFVMILMVTAAIGPLVLFVGMLAQAIAGVIAFVSAVSASMIMWTGVVLIVGTSLLFLLDALLQLTGKGNLGILDLVRGTRLFGATIETHMEVAWLRAFQFFDVFKHDVIMGFLELEFQTRQVAGKLWRLLVDAFHKIATAFIQLQDFMTFGGFSNTFRQAIQDMHGFFNATLDKSLKEAEKRRAEHQNKVIAMERDFAKEMKVYDDTIASIFEEDRKRAERDSKVKLPDSISTVVERAEVTVPEVPEVKLPENAELKIETPAVTPPAADMRAQEFQTVSLRRFALEGQGGLSRAVAAKQEVKAKGVEDKLDVTNNHLSRIAQNGTTAVLG